MALIWVYKFHRAYPFPEQNLALLVNFFCLKSVFFLQYISCFNYDFLLKIASQFFVSMFGVWVWNWLPTLGGLGLCVGCPPWGSVKGILAFIYGSFGENHEKLQTARLTSTTGNWTRHLPSTSFEHIHHWLRIMIMTDIFFSFH